MTTALSVRIPELEWAHRQGRGSLGGVGWVDSRLDPALKPMRQSRDGHGPSKFRQEVYSQFLPAPVLEAAVAAQQADRPTGWETLSMLYAKCEWTVASRRYLWSPYSPYPKLLATLVETYGVEAPVHGYDPDRLARLAALMPVWHPYRGTLDRARQVLDAAGETELLDAAQSIDVEVRGGQNADLVDEILCCHRLDWWEHRRKGEATPEYRIQAGFLRFQPAGRDKFVLQKEDVLLSWQPGRSLPRDAIRLLPGWTTFRLAVATPKKTRKRSAASKTASTATTTVPATTKKRRTRRKKTT